MGGRERPCPSEPEARAAEIVCAPPQPPHRIHAHTHTQRRRRKEVPWPKSAHPRPTTRAPSPKGGSEFAPSGKRNSESGGACVRRLVRPARVGTTINAAPPIQVVRARVGTVITPLASRAPFAWAPPCTLFLACAPCTRSDHSHCVPRLRCTYTHHAGRASLALARRRTLPCSLGHCLGVRGKGLGLSG